MYAYTLIIPGLGSSKAAVDDIRDMLASRCTGMIDVFNYDSKGHRNVVDFMQNTLSGVGLGSTSTRVGRLTKKLVEILTFPEGTSIHILAHSHGALLLYNALMAISAAKHEKLSIPYVDVDVFGPAKMIPQESPCFQLGKAVNHFERND
jgi:hypothetical protein